MKLNKLKIKVLEFIVNELKSKLEDAEAKQFHADIVEWDERRKMVNKLVECGRILRGESND